MPLSEPPFLDAPYNFCLPRLVIEAGGKSVPIDANVEQVYDCR
jgi:hypothetical protein